MMIVICDLDGTLCECRHRQHLATARDWDGFHERLSDDYPIRHTLEFLNMCAANRWPIIFLTGRPIEVLDETVAWIYQHADLEFGCDWYDLIMRPRGDFTPDRLLKPALLKASIEDQDSPIARHILEYLARSHSYSEEMSYLEAVEEHFSEIQENILVLDDREGVVEAMRNEGYTVWQVAQGVY